MVSFCVAEKVRGPVLDVGAGSGLFADAFKKAGENVIGIDLRKDMAVAANTVLEEALMAVGDMHALPLAADCFSLAFMGHVLHESDRPGGLLKEVHRVAPQVVALEWPYRQEAMGPPLAHRLSPAAAENAPVACGSENFAMILLEHMILYHYY